MPLSMWQRKAYIGEERRGDVRAECVGSTVIDVLSPQPQTSVEARVLDAGSSGLMLGLPFPLSPGAILRVVMTDAVAEGEVRYCTREASEFHVGVKIEEIVPKDR